MSTPLRRKTILTNYDFSITYRFTGDYSTKNWYADLTAGDDTTLMSFAIAKSYAAGTDKTTLILSLTKVQVNTLTVGRTYYADLKLDDTTETVWIKFVFDIEVGKTKSAL